MCLRQQSSEEAIFLNLPILSQLAPESFDYGRVFLVEFEPQSLWYEATYTITADSLKKGIRTEYHTYSHIPKDIRESLAKYGVNVKAMETDSVFRILDSYTVQTGLGAPDMPMHKTSQQAMAESMKLSNWSIADAQAMKAPTENDLRWLHMDDNVSALGSYNDGKTILNYCRTRIIPQARRFETAFVNALLVKVHSDLFYSQFESLCDGILDFRSREDGTRLLQEARVRVIRGKACDSRWHRLDLRESGEVAVVD